MHRDTDNAMELLSNVAGYPAHDYSLHEHMGIV